MSLENATNPQLQSALNAMAEEIHRLKRIIGKYCPRCADVKPEHDKFCAIHGEQLKRTGLE